MQIAYSASGSKAHVAQELLKQSRQLRATEPESAALIMSVRDELIRHVDATDDDDILSLSATVSVTATVKKPAPKDAKVSATAPEVVAAKP